MPLTRARRLVQTHYARTRPFSHAHATASRAVPTPSLA